jgi:hypothetical protein
MPNEEIGSPSQIDAIFREVREECRHLEIWASPKNCELAHVQLRKVLLLDCLWGIRVRCSTCTQGFDRDNYQDYRS